MNKGSSSAWKHLLVSALLFLPFLSFGQSQQEYSQSAGVRFGSTTALTYKKFLVTEEAIEILISGRHDGLQLTSMYLFHDPMQLAFSPNFFAYYGAGAHFGYEKRRDMAKVLIGPARDDFQFEEETFFVMGADFIIGVEYRWLAAPITISFDVKPYFDYIGMRKVDSRFWDSAISFKYIF